MKLFIGLRVVLPLSLLLSCFATSEAFGQIKHRLKIDGLDAQKIDRFVTATEEISGALRSFIEKDEDTGESGLTQALQTIEQASREIVICGKDSLKILALEVSDTAEIEATRPELEKSCDGSRFAGTDLRGEAEVIELENCIVKEALRTRSVPTRVLRNRYSSLREMAHARVCRFKTTPEDPEYIGVMDQYARLTNLVASYTRVSTIPGCEETSPTNMARCARDYVELVSNNLSKFHPSDTEGLPIQELLANSNETPEAQKVGWLNPIDNFESRDDVTNLENLVADASALLEIAKVKRLQREMRYESKKVSLTKNLQHYRHIAEWPVSQLRHHHGTCVTLDVCPCRTMEHSKYTRFANSLVSLAKSCNDLSEHSDFKELYAADAELKATCSVYESAKSRDGEILAEFKRLNDESKELCMKDIARDRKPG